MTGLKWKVVEDWWGISAKAVLAGLSIECNQIDGFVSRFAVWDDDNLLVQGKCHDWSSCLRRAQTAASLILKSRMQACPIPYEQAS